MHTSLGDIKIEVQCAKAPKLCEVSYHHNYRTRRYCHRCLLLQNFLALAASGAYDGTLFHRNIRGFLVQGGDPTGTGKGGDSIWGTKLADEFNPELSHDSRGVVAMAGNGPNTIGSQFYITYARALQLDNQFSVIGKVIGGMSVLDAMEKVPVSGKKYRPTTDIVIERITIHANPFAQV